MTEVPGIDPSVAPSGTGCVECDAKGGWWVHLRRCAQCGHIGCCDSSPAQHASAHAAEQGHPFVRSFEPGEGWFWNYRTEEFYDGPELVGPEHHPLGQPAPGPAGRVPENWQALARQRPWRASGAGGPGAKRPLELRRASDPRCSVLGAAEVVMSGCCVVAGLRWSIKGWPGHLDTPLRS